MTEDPDQWLMTDDRMLIIVPEWHHPLPWDYQQMTLQLSYKDEEGRQYLLYDMSI